MFKFFEYSFKPHTRAGVGEIKRTLYSGDQLETILPCQCCGARFGRPGNPGLEVRQYSNDPDEYPSYGSAPTKGVRVFPFVVEEAVVEEYETHHKISMGGQEWSLLTVDHALRTSDYITKNTQIQEFPKDSKPVQEVYFIHWQDCIPIPRYNVSFFLEVGTPHEEAKILENYYTHRHQDLRLALEEGKHLFFILISSQLAVFNSEMGKMGLTNRIKSLGAPVANLNYYKKDNPRLYIFYIEGKQNV